MKAPFLSLLAAAFGLTACTNIALSPTVDFHQHVGLQLWSVRAQLRENVPAALDLVKSYGITEVETFGVPGITVPQLAQELRNRGLRATSGHMGYDALKKDIVGAIADAKTLGIKMIIVPSLPHRGRFTEEDARRIAVDFNVFGAACKSAGLGFGYHPHGFEFTPTAAGNGEVVFDVLVRETKPELVSFEMDVFWVFHAGQDPVALLNKYPNRWVALHVKDMRKGAIRGLSTGSAAPIDNVTVGTGLIDWPNVLRTAQKLGIRHYYIEDETPTPLQCIPDSLNYLRALKL